MGLFSGIGKLLGGVVKTAVGVAKIAAPIALGGPLGGLAGGLAGKLIGGKGGRIVGSIIAAKRPMSHTPVKIATASNPRLMRGNATQGGYSAFQTPQYGYRPPAAVLRAVPIMPGGAVATSSGIAPRGAPLPAQLGGSSAGGTKRKRRKSTTKRRASSGRKRRGRKLKFGSPAWRKKYLGHGRRKKRRAA